ncbi:hypothetical protein BDN71DRAFT_1535964 [Pleurotus eryngii]|uniref:Uncharacterized protein n=1 Tax=Pleurotus eryngii TaxID=5323 RepID=A0A9P5ZIQ5_PLEER|nr:hypothetical protein BDN71DRAFT_1535964 [Pleurotus eryngii]
MSIIYPTSSVVLAHHVVSSTMGNTYSQSSISLSTVLSAVARAPAFQLSDVQCPHASCMHQYNPPVNFNLHQVDACLRSNNEEHENEPPATVPLLSRNEELENMLNMKTRQHRREKSLPHCSVTQLQIVDQLLSKPVESLLTPPTTQQSNPMYNMALAFTSLGVKQDYSINQWFGGNTWVFRIQGQLHHNSGALESDEGVAPSYTQLYVHDPNVALQQRMHRNSALSQDTMSTLQTVLI